MEKFVFKSSESGFHQHEVCKYGTAHTDDIAGYTNRRMSKEGLKVGDQPLVSTQTWAVFR